MTNQTISKNQMNFEQFTIKTEQQQQIRGYRQQFPVWESPTA